VGINVEDHSSLSFADCGMSNARICMLTEVGSSFKLEPTEDAGEAAPEL
jgi:hypothetical protein